jgi:hypothetical protein
MFERPLSAANDEQTGFIPPGGGMLGNQVLGKMVIEEHVRVSVQFSVFSVQINPISRILFSEN